MDEDSGTAGMLATVRALGNGETGQWWHKQWVAPTGEAAGRAVCRWRFGSAGARLGEVQ